MNKTSQLQPTSKTEIATESSRKLICKLEIAFVSEPYGIVRLQIGHREQTYGNERFQMVPRGETYLGGSPSHGSCSVASTHCAFGNRLCRRSISKLSFSNGTARPNNSDMTFANRAARLAQHHLVFSNRSSRRNKSVVFIAESVVATLQRRFEMGQLICIGRAGRFAFCKLVSF